MNPAHVMNVALNGFGVIGQEWVRRVVREPRFRLVAVNEEWLKADEAATQFAAGQPSTEPALIISSDRGRLGACSFAWRVEKSPGHAFWRELGADAVIEASRRLYRTELQPQVGEGVIVLMTGDTRDTEPDLTLVPGVNEGLYRAVHRLLCAGSDRTQALCPVLYCIDEAFHIAKAEIDVYRPPYERADGQRPPDGRGDAERLARVLRGLSGRLVTRRHEDSTYTVARGKLVIEVERAVAFGEVATRLTQFLDSRFFVGESSTDAPTGDLSRACVQVVPHEGKSSRIDLKVTFDHVGWYSTRLNQILAFLQEHRNDLGD